MKLSTPRWWYVRRSAPAPTLRILLRPLSWIWAAATARRVAKPPRFDPGVPVISVGGLTVGGVGKTPVVRALLRRLGADGVEAHALSRGYGGRLKGPVRADPAHHGAGDIGDEPLMLAKDFPVWVSRDRVAGAKAAVAGGAKALVLDDAHQNPALAKTLSLVVVDAETRDGEWPFGDGAVFPAGPMRESFSAGLARADAVVLMLPEGLDRPDAELLELFAGKSVLVARLVPVAPPPPGPQLAFAGIAKPWKFRRALETAGAELIDFAAFPDHAPFAEAELDFLAARAADDGAGLLTTEKDWVRLPPAWRERVAAWPVEVRFEDEAAVGALLRSSLAAQVG